MDLMPWLPSGIIVLLLAYTLRRWLLHWDALEAERDARAAGSFPKPRNLPNPRDRPEHWGEFHVWMLENDPVYAEIDAAAPPLPGTSAYVRAALQAHQAHRAEAAIHTPPWARDVPARDQEPSRLTG